MNELTGTDYLFDVSKRTIQRWISRAGENAAEDTGNDDFRDVSAHDLRATFATHLLVEQGMNPRVVMATGGWSSYQAIKPYLGIPTEDTIIRELESAGLQ